jgi:hypothetical protein
MCSMTVQGMSAPKYFVLGGTHHLGVGVFGGEQQAALGVLDGALARRVDRFARHRDVARHQRDGGQRLLS